METHRKRVKHQIIPSSSPSTLIIPSIYNNDEIKNVRIPSTPKIFESNANSTSSNGETKMSRKEMYKYIKFWLPLFIFNTEELKPKQIDSLLNDLEIQVRKYQDASKKTITTESALYEVLYDEFIHGFKKNHFDFVSKSSKFNNNSKKQAKEQDHFTNIGVLLDDVIKTIRRRKKERMQKERKNSFI